MWLDARLRYEITRFDPSQNVVPWRVDVKVPADIDALPPGAPSSFSVGRIMADELRRYELDEWGSDCLETADADSVGLEMAVASLLDADGELRLDEYECICDPIVYIYRLEIHPDFADYRLAVLDAFCRLFNTDALILAQYKTTWFSLTEFQSLGFQPLKPKLVSYDPKRLESETELLFIVRDNTLKCDFEIANYPKSMPSATAEHESWLEAQSNWKVFF